MMDKQTLAKKVACLQAEVRLQTVTLNCYKDHLRKTIALLDDMRMVDKYNARTQFNVLDWEKELRAAYPELIEEE
jgi:hypothetical protein